MIKVAKFGGSSLADAEQFKKVKNIIENDENRRIVVVSAAGKRFKEDNKITDLLYLCYAHIKYSVSYESMFSIIENRYLEIRDELGLKCNLESEFRIIKSRMKKGMNRDYLVSRGEYLAGMLMAEYLGYDFIDAENVIFFDYNGKVDIEKTREAMEKAIERNPKGVIPGFYGTLPNGEIKLFSRGGSDITGAIVSDCIKAAVYENWTDVSGILMADPNVVKDPKRIEIITYSELRELSYMGANVLHTDAVAPVKKANIPINIRNTNAPENPGTIIVDENNELLKNAKNYFITGIAGKKDFSVISIYKDHMSGEVGAIRKVLEIFEKYKVSIEHIPTGIDTFSIVTATENIKKYLYEIVADIKKECDPSEVKVIDNISLIATVGRNMADRPGMSGKLFAAIGNSGVNIRMISQGSDEINIIVGVENEDFEKAINVIYNNFVI